MNIPQRQTLTQLTARTLLDGIASGEWRGTLPGERELCLKLNVSRPTLRAALEILEREGVLGSPRQGKQRSILAVGPSSHPVASNTVALISRLPLHSMTRNRIFLIDAIHRVLQAHGLRVEMISHPAFGTQRPARALHLLRERERFRAYVLLLSSRALQQWFCEEALPAIVVGSVYPGLSMPSIDSDYQSIGHHAAGCLLGKGHRRIALIVPENNHAGDLETEERFLATLRQQPGTRCCVIRHGADSTELVEKIDAILAGPEWPTAFFLLSAMATTTLVTHLAMRNIRIPADASVITRDGDPLLGWIRPPVAQYSFPLRQMARRISRMVIDTCDSGLLPLNHVRLMPQFLRGESLAASPAPEEAT